VRRVRYQRKFSQAQLATHCQLYGWNASRDIIAAIESQIRYVTDKEILSLAKALKVPFPNLFP
jgi:transcriptional regulator with XRE-family HTH domain